MEPFPNTQPDAIAGAILGCAVGDALGLPYENLSKRRGVRLLGEPERHRFLFGRGMVSDDTEHTCLIAEALCAAPRDVDVFVRYFARGVRWWLLGLPVGLGRATLRAGIKLWLGYSPTTSGVFSAGNAPAMRTAILGAAIDDLERLRRYVDAATRVTHTDPKAHHGAFVVALAAWCARRGLHTRDQFFTQLRSIAFADANDEIHTLLTRVETSLAMGETTAVFAESLGCGRGVTGYTYHTVPVAIHAWLTHPRDFRAATISVIRCGGDADTTAAIVGGLVGSGVGRVGIPQAWLASLWEWPRSVAWMERLAAAVELATMRGEPVSSPRVFPVIGLVRNAVFFVTVLVHIGRRLLPPY